MTSRLKYVMKAYSLDWYAIALFLLVSLSFKGIYRFMIPIIITVSVIQIIRGLTKRISLNQLTLQYLYLLIFSTIFYKSVQTLILLTLVLILLLFLGKNNKTKTNVTLTTEVLTIGLFFLIATNLVIHEPLFKSLGKYLYLLLLPLVFIVLKRVSITVDIFKCIHVFISSVLLATVFVFGLNLYQGNISITTNTYFSSALDLTHVYFGMFVGLAACFLLILQKEKHSYISKLVDRFILFWLLLILIHIGARIALIAVLFVGFTVLFQSLRWPLFFKSIATLVIVGLFSFASYTTIPRVKDDLGYIKQLYMSVKNDNKEDLIHNSWRNMYQRYLVTSYTVDKIKERPWLGIGLQNVKTTVSKQILDDGYKYFEPLNSHNQYLHFWVGTGIFGLLYFLWMLYKFYKLQTYALYFLSFFMIIMLTESVLVRIKGISLFFLFSLILSYKENSN